MIDKHKEFAEAMRDIMRNEEKRHKENDYLYVEDDLDEESRPLQELLEQKFEDLFGPIDDEGE